MGNRTKTVLKFQEVKTPGNITAEAVTEEPKKEFLSEVLKKISYVRLNLSEKCYLELYFDISGELENAELHGMGFGSKSNNPIETGDITFWDWIITSEQKEFEETLKTIEKVREEIKKHLDD